MDKMNIDWNTFRSKLRLDNEQTILIKYILNRLKDDFAEVCNTETIDYESSPIEHAAELKVNNPEIDDKHFKQEFIDYLSKTKPGTNATYLKTCEKLNLSTEAEVNRLLNEEQRELLLNLQIERMLDIDTGHKPLQDKIVKQIEKYEEISKRNINTFCSIPFEYAHIEDTGDVYPCCPSKFKLAIGDLNSDSLQEIWNSKAAVAVRKSIINKTFKYCDFEECEYLKDKRFMQKEGVDNDVQREIKAVNSNSEVTAPEIINLAYDRTCNLKCPYCRLGTHNSQEDINQHSVRIHDHLFGESLYGVQRLIIAGNGEPFVSRLYMDLLQNFDHKKYPELKIKIQTNGLLLTPEKWDSIAQSHVAIDWISVSIDAATEETYKINRGGDFDRLLENLEFVSELRRSDKIKLFFINFIVQANNYKEMRQFVELGLRYGCDMVDFQLLENWGTYSPDEFKKVAIQDKVHPEHKEFLEVLNDPIFANPAVSTCRLLEFLPGYIKKWIGTGSIIKYEDFGQHIKL